MSYDLDCILELENSLNPSEICSPGPSPVQLVVVLILRMIFVFQLCLCNVQPKLARIY